MLYKKIRLFCTHITVRTTSIANVEGGDALLEKKSTDPDFQSSHPSNVPAATAETVCSDILIGGRYFTESI